MSEQRGENQNSEGQRPELKEAETGNEELSAREEELTCVACGHPIEQDDLECPNCGISLVAG